MGEQKLGKETIAAVTDAKLEVKYLMNLSPIAKATGNHRYPFYNLGCKKLFLIKPTERESDWVYRLYRLPQARNKY